MFKVWIIKRDFENLETILLFVTYNIGAYTLFKVKKNLARMNDRLTNIIQKILRYPAAICCHSRK